MNRLGKVIPKEAIIPEFRYLVVCNNGLIAWNGAIGIRYGNKYVGEKLSIIRESIGTFAFPDATQFLKIVSTLGKIDSVDFNEQDSSLRLVANSGRAKVRLPIVRISDELKKGLPHLKIQWPKWEEVGKGFGIEIGDAWVEVSKLLTKEGVSLWGDVVGLYEVQKGLVAFDYGVLMVLERDKGKGSQSQQLFCPRTLLQLGLNGMKFVGLGIDGTLFIVGDGVQYCTTAVKTEFVLDRMMEMRKQSIEGKKEEVKLDYSANVWKRAKLFSQIAITLEIVDGNILLKEGDWEERIGITTAPSSKFVTRMSLLERWMSGTLNHGFSINNGEWYLMGTLRSGVEFIGLLTSVGQPVVETSDESEVDPSFGLVEESSEVETLL